MASNKKTTFKDSGPQLDDLNFDLIDFDNEGTTKKDKKRKPITKVATNIAKGSLGHFTSEAFVRSTVAKALPPGYDAGADMVFGIKDNANQLYNTAAQEWRKMAPTARRVVDRMMPSAQALLPKKLAQKLDAFAKGGSSSSSSYNADEATLREVLGELERTSLTERLRENAQTDAKNEIKDQIEARRYQSSIKALASIDSRLAQIQAFNDQSFSRYQRRSLEIQYRQYFTARDTQKLLGAELGQTRQLLQAVVHNTALPDSVKATLRTTFDQSLRQRLSTSTQNAMTGYTATFLKELKDRLSKSITNVASGAHSALGGIEMGQDAHQMAREMGMDVSGGAQKNLGAFATNHLLNWIGGMAQGAFKRSGFTAQRGARMGRFVGNLPDFAKKWAMSQTKRGGVLGAAEQALKDQMPLPARVKRVGGSALLEAHDAGLFTKKFQRSVEEIMPSYLSMILHELTMSRTGNAKAERIVWNDDKSTFTTHKQQGQDAIQRILKGKNAEYGKQQVGEYASKMLAGKKVSGAAYAAMQKQLMDDVLSGKMFDPRDWVKPNAAHSHIDPELRKEIAQAMRGRFKGANGRTDQVTVGNFTKEFKGLRSTVHDPLGQISAYRDLGLGDHLKASGLIRDEGDDSFADYDNVVKQMYAGHSTADHVSPYSREESETMGGGTHYAFFQPKTDLYKAGTEVNGKPLIEGAKVVAGYYRNPTTTDPIRSMQGLVHGVMSANGQLLANPTQVMKLVTRQGETLAAWLDRNARAASGRSKFGHAVNKHVTKAVHSFDDYMGSGKGKHAFRRAKDKAKRGAAHAQAYTASHAHAAAAAAQSVMDDAVTPGTTIHATLQAAAESAKGVAQTAVASATKKSKPWKDKALEALRSTWTKIMDVKHYAMDLHKRGEVVPTIRANALKAGDYISAKTGKPITDMRELIDGVKDRKGNWIISAKQAAMDLYAQTGELYTDLVSKAQEAVAAAKTSAPVQQTVQAAQAAHAAYVSPAVEAVQQAAAAHAASAQAAPINATRGESEPLEPLMEIIKEFKDGNLKHLEEILATLTHRDFTQTGGVVMGDPSAVKGGKGSLMDRMRKTRLGLVGRWGSGAISGAWSGLKSGARHYGSYVKHVGSLPFRAIGTAGRLTASLFRGRLLNNEPADVFVKGEVNPRLTKGAMMAGEYFNIKKDGSLGSPIHVPADIKGPVKNAQGDTLIDMDAFSKGLTDKMGKSIMGRLAHGTWGGAKALAKFYGTIFSTPFKVVNFVASTIASIANLSKLPQDVYTPDDMKTPKLFAMGMKAGIYVDRESGKKVRRVADIRGEVLDVSKNPPIVALKLEDIKDIVDIKGKRFKVKAGLLARLGGGVLGVAGAAFSGYTKVLGALIRGGAHVAKAGLSVAAAPFAYLARMLNPQAIFNRTKKGVNLDKTNKLIEEVLHLLDARMPSKKNYRAGSWEEQYANRHKNAAPTTLGGKLKAKGSSILGKLKGLLHRKPKTDANGNPITDAINDGKGLWNIAKKTGGVLKKGWGLIKGLGGVAAADGLGAGGAGMATAGAAEGATIAASAAGGAGVLGTAGAGIATAAAAVGEGAAVAASALGSILSLPVLLGAAAVAGVAYLGYKAYQYYGLKKKAPLRKMRMAQYGVDMNKGVMNAGKIQKLEGMLTPYVTIKEGKATFSQEAITKNKDDILKLFDLARSWYNPVRWFKHNTGDKDPKKMEFYAWFAKRFEPVFCNWVAFMHGIDPKLNLSDADSDLKPEQKRTLLKQAMAMDPSVYEVAATPFGDDPVCTGSAVVKAAYDEALKDLGPIKADAKGKAAATVAKTATVAAAATVAGKGIQAASNSQAGALAAATKNTAGAGSAAKVGLNAVGTLKDSLGFLNGKLTGLMATRYKTYGLIALEPDRIKALFLLETDVLDKVQYDGSGTASFDGDVSYFFATYAGYFGVGPTDEKAKLRWYSWFAKRFIPTLLQFATAVKHANKTTDPRDADQYLSPQHLLDVANMVKAATFKSGAQNASAQTASVWTFLDSPFDDKPLNADVKSVDGNIQALKDAVQRRIVAEEQAKKDKSANAQSIKNAANQKPGASPKAANDGSYNQKKPMQASVALPRGLDPGSAAALKFQSNGGKPGAPVGKVVQQPGNGTAGDINKVPTPTGSGWPGIENTVVSAAKMAGIDPELLGTFMGIESSFNPDAHAPTSSASGLMQFINSTWEAMIAKYGKKYGIAPGTPQTDARASALLGAEFIKENQRYLTKVLGRAPTDTELYVAHFLGPGGAKQLLSAPDSAIGAAIAPKAASANAGIFYRSGQALTKGAILALLNQKVSRNRKLVADADTFVPKTDSSGLPGAPSTGGNTTTTANGAKGGINGAALAKAGSAGGSGSAGLAAIAPPGGPGGKTSAGAMASGSDPVTVHQQVMKQRAMIADQAAKVSGDLQGVHTATIANHAQQQTALLKQTVNLLTSVVKHTSAIPTMGASLQANATASATDASGAQASTPTTPAPTPTPLPTAPVSVQRQRYG